MPRKKPAAGGSPAKPEAEPAGLTPAEPAAAVEPEPGGAPAAAPSIVPEPGAAAGAGAAGAAPVDPPAAPWVVKPEDLDISGLPELQYPGAARDPSFQEWAEERRKRRIRTEIVGGVILVALGIGGAFVMRAPQVAALAVLAAAGVAIYEFLVNSFE